MIELYIRKDCPFCVKVVQAVARMNLQEGTDYQLIDASPGTPARQVVVEVGGKAMVPFLIDGETSMYESDDIILYLRKKSGGHQQG